MHRPVPTLFQIMTTDEKEFGISRVFKNVSSMKVDEWQCSPIEKYFDVPWCISIKRNEESLAMFLVCFQENKGKEWSIEVWNEGKIKAKNGKTHSTASDVIFKNTGQVCWGWGEFIKWEDMMKDYVVGDSVTVELRVKIKKVTGIVLKENKKNLRNFDESTKEFSDVVLVVENQKFYVSKLYLSSQSPYFKAVFLREAPQPSFFKALFKKSKQSEIPLNDVKAKDFQNFLELLHGESPIDESTVEGIVHLANMYDAKQAVQKCQQFLIESSKKSLNGKLQMAHRYNLEDLRDHCLPMITTTADIRAVLSNDHSEIGTLVVSALMQKMMDNTNN